MQIVVTTSNKKAYAVRATPSLRCFNLVRTHAFGEPSDRAIAIAKAVEKRLNKVAKRGYLTDGEKMFNRVPKALVYAKLPKVRCTDAAIFISEPVDDAVLNIKPMFYATDGKGKLQCITVRG